MKAGGTDPLRTVAAVNFLLFAGIAMAIGGDALNGTARHGVYFVGMHGHFHRVSHALWLYSLIHEIATFALILSALAHARDRREQAEEAAKRDSRAAP